MSCSRAQQLAHLVQSRGGGVLGQRPRLEIINPFLDGAFSYLVEVVDLEDVVFREELADGIDLELFLLEGVQLQDVPVVDTAELGLAVIDIVGAFAEGEINDVDAIDLADMLVVLASTRLALSSSRSRLPSLSKRPWILTVLPKREERKPSRTSKLALLRSRRFIAQSKRM